MRSSLALLSLLLLLATAACGGRQPVAVGGEDLLTGGEAASMMGEQETLARGLLEDMAVVLEANADDPEAAVARMEAFLRVNRQPMRDSATAIANRRASLSPAEARRYEAQLSAFLAPPNRAWREVFVAFQQEHGESARRIERMVRAVDD